MDKVTRILLLYFHLARGDKINKTVFCLDYDCSPRTFDRDIEDLRLFLTEAFSRNELKYDRKNDTYFIEGISNTKLEVMELLFLYRILQDTAVLRKDEHSALLENLTNLTEGKRLLTNISTEEYETYSQDKALLKMHGDISVAIASAKSIKISFYSNNNDEEVIPCMVRYRDGKIYLIGLNEMEGFIPQAYRIDEIESFTLIRDQRNTEKAAVSSFIDQYSDGKTIIPEGRCIDITIKCDNCFYPYLKKEFCNYEIVQQEENNIVLRVKSFEDGLINWIIAQSSEKFEIVAPETTKERLIAKCRTIVEKHGGK